MSSTPAGPPPVGMWRTLVRGWPAFVVIVLGQAAVQSLLLLPDPVPELSMSFITLFVGSLAALLVGVWLTVAAASAAQDGVARDALGRAVRRPGVLVWSLAVGVIATGASLVTVWLAPVVLVVGSFTLPAATTGGRHVLARAYRPVLRAPVRFVLAVLGALVLVAVSWVVALLLGFFVTGLPAAVLTWTWFGTAATFVLCAWCSLYRRANPAEAPPPPVATKA